MGFKAPVKSTFAIHEFHLVIIITLYYNTNLVTTINCTMINNIITIMLSSFITACGFTWLLLQTRARFMPLHECIGRETIDNINCIKLGKQY